MKKKLKNKNYTLTISDKVMSLSGIIKLSKNADLKKDYSNFLKKKYS
jgi:hypothetical protein